MTSSDSDFIYTPCYCEENIWHFCKVFAEGQKIANGDLFVIFISNQNKQVPIWNQKINSEKRMAIWDYHVIALERSHQSDVTAPFPSDNALPSFIFDFDTSLSFKSLATDYYQQCLLPAANFRPQFSPIFRIIRAEDYLLHFASDRSHMIKADGSYSSSPPTYPAIRTSQSTMNLHDFISMENNWIPSEIKTLHEFGVWLDG